MNEYPHIPNDGTKYLRGGRIELLPLETPTRTLTRFAEKTMTSEVVGDYDDLVDVLRIREIAPAAFFPTIKGEFNWYIKSVEITREDANTGIAKVVLVNCPNGPSKPYSWEWSIGIEEVSMKLISHPRYRDNIKAQNTIQRWEETDPQWRVRAKSSEGTVAYDYCYMARSQDESGASAEGAERYDPDDDSSPFVVVITDEVIKDYCSAVLAGIETYNKYLPVVTKTSNYLKVPGADYDEDGRCEGGVVTGFEGIGKFDTPDLTAEGYPGQGNNWFKSKDSYSINTDGSATRTESWTYTDDTRFSWIYEEAENEQ